MKSLFHSCGWREGGDGSLNHYKLYHDVGECEVCSVEFRSDSSTIEPQVTHHRTAEVDDSIIAEMLDTNLQYLLSHNMCNACVK